MNSRRGGLFALAALSATALAVPATAASAAPAPTPARQNVPTDVRLIDGDYKGGAPLPFTQTAAAKLGAAGTAGERSTLSSPRTAAGTSSDADLEVGEQKDWLSLVDGGVTPDGEEVAGGIDVRGYTLRGLGDHIEVWVADDLSFPAGDCRNTLDGGALTKVTDEQAQGFADEFDENMLPKESEAFSVAPDRDGTKGVMGEVFPDAGYPADYWVGKGDRTVALIDNVRDQNFYDPTNANGRTYIAGFFFSTFNELLDRNVMTIDGFDWLHRTGTNPPDDSGDADYLACADFLGRPGLGEPSPRTYEGTFAHEYQHLLEYYADPDEVNWVNEGLSDWAQTLVGYVDPTIPLDDPAADNHLSTYYGWNPQESFGGPEQSLTQWGDQGDPEILADYGAAYAFMFYLHDHFGGDAFMKALHDEPANGLVGLQTVLDRTGHRVKATDVLHDFLAMNAVDAAIDAGAKVKRGNTGRLTTASLSAKVNWDNPQAYESPGAPVNGADYVRLRSLDGWLSDGLVDFTGAKNYPVAPVEWTAEDGNLVSGSGDNLDRAVVRTFDVPAADPTVTLGLDLDTEEGYDYFYVQVYDAATGTWVNLPTEGADENTGGLSGTFQGEKTFDASQFAGQTVDVALRYVTDGGVSNPGVTVTSVSVGGTPVADAGDLSTWKSLTQAHPVPVAGWTVQLVGYDEKKVSVVKLPVVSTPWGWKTVTPVKLALGFRPDVAAVLVTADDPTETAPSYAPYQLFANGVLQPGGGSGA
ncbi:peptidase M6 [Kineococcus sp. NPDC059986]|uniref:peptidase M6 n=1 Tax=Kineococcus sp. NPDC059986 TaxID=3155538 RepID=UPI00344BB884